MAEIEVITKKWGSSLGVVIPKNIVEKEHIKEKEKLKIEIKKMHKAKDVFGMLKGLKINTQKAKDEMRKGWD